MRASGISVSSQLEQHCRQHPRTVCDTRFTHYHADTRLLYCNQASEDSIVLCFWTLCNTCGHVFTDGRFVYFEPIQSKSEAGNSLVHLTQQVGVLNWLVFDGAKEQVGPRTEFMRSIRKNQIDWKSTEPSSH